MQLSLTCCGLQQQRTTFLANVLSLTIALILLVGLSLFAYFFQCSSVVQTFIQKSPCQVPRVLDVIDCPPHNIVHDILHYPNCYGPLYYPECYPEVFATPSVKVWLETSLCSHISLCCPCSSMHKLLGVKFSVQWRDPHYLVCAYADGKLKQCTVSLEDLQSKTYANCQIVSRLCRPSLVVPPSDSSIDVYSVIAQEEPAWLFHSDDLYRLHLSQLPAPVLASAVVVMSDPLFGGMGDPSKIDTPKISRSQLSCKRILPLSINILISVVEQPERECSRS